MRTRFSVNAAGELEARDGTILGRLTSITLETPSSETPSLLPTPLNPSPTGKEKTTPVVPAELTLLPTPAEQVWSTYVEVMKPRRTTMDNADCATILRALQFVTVAECQRAILGCFASDWHMGRDPQTAGKSYKQLSQILKGKRGGRSICEQIEFFIEIADKAGIESPGVASVDRLKLSRAKQSVMTAWEFPADVYAEARGAEALIWLADNGIEVYTVDGRPSFRATR